MYDYHKMGTNTLKGLLEFKSNRLNGIKAGRLMRRGVGEDERLIEQINAIKAVIYARENTIKTEGF